MSNKTNRREFLSKSIQTSAAVLAFTMPGGLTAASSTTEPGSNAKWQIGCYTRPWDKHDYRVALDSIAQAGFKHAGLMTCNSEDRLVVSVKTSEDEAVQINEEVKKRKLEIASVYGGGIPVNESLQAGIDGLKKLIDNCAIVQSKTLLMGGTGDEKLYDVYYKAIAECCDYAAEKKVGITIKPHGGMNATGPQCRKLIEKLNHKNFTLWYDPGNIFYYSNGELNPVDDAKTVNGLVSGVCIKDYVHPKEVAVTPGAGQVDFPAVMAQLQKGGFTHGPLIIETLKPGTLSEINQQAKIARKFVEGLVL